jgi:hypothetical protein
MFNALSSWNDLPPQMALRTYAVMPDLGNNLPVHRDNTAGGEAPLAQAERPPTRGQTLMAPPPAPKVPEHGVKIPQSAVAQMRPPADDIERPFKGRN